MPSSSATRLRGLSAETRRNNTGMNPPRYHQRIMSTATNRAQAVNEALGDKENLGARLAGKRRGTDGVAGIAPSSNSSNHNSNRTNVPIGVCENTTAAISIISNNGTSGVISVAEEIRQLPPAKHSSSGTAGSPLAPTGSSPLAPPQHRLQFPEQRIYSFNATALGYRAGGIGGSADPVPNPISPYLSPCTSPVAVSHRQTPLLSPSSRPRAGSFPDDVAENDSGSPAVGHAVESGGTPCFAGGGRCAAELAWRWQNPPSPLRLTPSRLFDSSAASRESMYAPSLSAGGRDRLGCSRFLPRRLLAFKCSSAGKTGVLEERSMVAESKRADNETVRRPASARTTGGSQVGSVKQELHKGMFFSPDVEASSPHPVTTKTARRTDAYVASPSATSARTVLRRTDSSSAEADDVETTATAMAAWPIGETTVPTGFPPLTSREMPPDGVDAPASVSPVVICPSAPGLMLPRPFRCDEAVSREVEAKVRRICEITAARRSMSRTCERSLDSPMDEDFNQGSSVSVTSSGCSESFLSLSTWERREDGRGRRRVGSVGGRWFGGVNASCSSSVDTCCSIASFDGRDDREPTAREEAMAGGDPVARMLLDQSDDEKPWMLAKAHIDAIQDDDDTYMPGENQRSQTLRRPADITGYLPGTVDTFQETNTSEPPSSTPRSSHRSSHRATPALPCRSSAANASSGHGDHGSDRPGASLGPTVASEFGNPADDINSSTCSNAASGVGNLRDETAFLLGSRNACGIGTPVDDQESFLASHAFAGRPLNPNSFSSHTRAKSVPEARVRGGLIDTVGGEGVGDGGERLRRGEVRVTRHWRAVSLDDSQHRSRYFRPIAFPN